MKIIFTSFSQIGKACFATHYLLISLILLAGCDKGEESVEPQKITVAFDQSSANLMKSSGSDHPAKITLSFSEPLLAPSIITLKVSSALESGIDYQMVSGNCQENACAIEIAKGEKQLVIEVFSIDNENNKGDQDVLFEISNVSEGMAIPSEAITKFTLTIIDDEAKEEPTKTAVSFDKVSDTLGENAWPAYASAKITFSQELPAPGFIIIKEITTLRWGYEYDTFYGMATPKCVDGYDCEVVVHVDKGEKEISGVEIFAFDNNDVNGDREIAFQIVEVSEGIQMPDGEAGTFTLTVVDDE